MRMKPENKNIFTIMLVPADGENIRRFQISQIHFKKLKKISIVLFSILLLFACHYFYLFASQLSQVENNQDTEKVSAVINQFSQKLDRSQTQLEGIEQIQEKLKHLAQLSDPNRNLAIGPVTTDKDSSGDVVPAEFMQKLFGQNFAIVETEYIDRSVENYQMAVSDNMRQIYELHDNYSSRLDLLSHTPAVSPSEGWVSSLFGFRFDPYTQNKEFHSGLDIAGNIGTPVVAPADGKVNFVGQQNAYGKMISIDHGMGLVTRYGHLSSVAVSAGQKIERGDLIGSMGNSGRSTGPHLHYEVLLHGIPQNPQNYILN